MAKDNEDIVGGNSTSLDLLINSLERRGKHRVVYMPDDEDYEKFVRRTHEYMVTVREINGYEEGKGSLRLSIEGWSGYLGLTRRELAKIATRGEPWSSFIDYVKGLIAAHKVAGAESGAIPPVVMMFDLVNNYGYVNTNVIKSIPQSRIEDKVISASMLPRLDVKPSEPEAEVILPDENTGGDGDG